MIDELSPIFYRGFPAAALAFLILSLVSARTSKYLSATFSGIGLLAILAWILIHSLALARPPLRTLGETRELYACLLVALGLILYASRPHCFWLMLAANFVASLFLFWNLLHQEALDQSLMPALQSPFFIPHVVVYILAYSTLGGATIISLRGLLRYRRKGTYITEGIIADDLAQVDELVHLGFAFLTMGLVLGAIWAKEAWGHYWAWDPKETWALATWICYLFYLHFRKDYALRPRLVFYWLTFSYLVLIVCWLAIRYLPTATESVHTYAG